MELQSPFTETGWEPITNSPEDAAPSQHRLKEIDSMKKDTSKSRIHAASTYKLYLISCIAASSGIVLMLKFPEMHTLEPNVDPLSFLVFGLSLKSWRLIHILSSLAFVLITVLHMYFNREFIRKTGSKKLSLNWVVGLALGIAIILLGVLAPAA